MELVNLDVDPHRLVVMLVVQMLNVMPVRVARLRAGQEAEVEVGVEEDQLLPIPQFRILATIITKE